LAIYEDGTREEKAFGGDVSEAEKLDGEGDGFWEESFGGHRDSKPLGPAAVGVDVAFPGSRHLYGLPEHASSLALPTTAGPDAHYAEPFRLYTLDVFEYELDEPMALYGGIPMVLSHTAARTVGAFWFNPTETFVDVAQSDAAAATHWISESGVVDLMLLPGPSPKAALQQFTQLVGTQALPPLFALGYHQCRWNYKDEKDVAAVHGKFEELNFPYDVLWLDIEHTDGKRYFTWDHALFPNPKAMIEKLAAEGRKMVTIIDPHLKRDSSYYIHSEATAKGLYVKAKEGVEDYDGWCWCECCFEP
jgi:alpha 1,3-glucosidase